MPSELPAVLARVRAVVEAADWQDRALVRFRDAASAATFPTMDGSEIRRLKEARDALLRPAVAYAGVREAYRTPPTPAEIEEVARWLHEESWTHPGGDCPDFSMEWHELASNEQAPYRSQARSLLTALGLTVAGTK